MHTNLYQREAQEQEGVTLIPGLVTLPSQEAQSDPPERFPKTIMERPPQAFVDMYGISEIKARSEVGGLDLNDANVNLADVQKVFGGLHIEEARPEEDDYVVYP